MDNFGDKVSHTQFYADYVDIDQDGYISTQDLETFL